MKKIIKILSVVLVVVFMTAVLASCGATTTNKPTPPKKNTGALTPSSIKTLADIPNYSNSNTYRFSTQDYGDTVDQQAKLTERINEKKEDVENGDDVNAVTKIFANSEATRIIEQMSVAGLPKDKMISTVDYLSGQETVELDDIRLLVASGTFNKNATKNWSFFDDYEYYKQLKDRAEETKDDTDEDNVKRQYRNMAGKVFAIGMTGDEFARVVTNELEYATEVTEAMSNAQISTETTGDDTAYDTYAKVNLDYETLVYLRSFNQYRNTSTGFTDCVELYGYYYDYNRTSYYSQTDEIFEKQLLYSHKKTYTDAEWWEYMTIERDSYVNAYRYSYSFYQKYYNKHFQFQTISESQETFVYGLNQWHGKSYTAEMRAAVSNDNFKGQLAMTDWLWCYNGSRETMDKYNQANTKYENNKGSNEERQKEGEFGYDMEQLKMIQYLLEKMTTTELSQMLRFQVYSYSSEMIEGAQGYNKDIVLIENLVKDPADAIKIIDGLTEQEARSYAKGKIEAMLDQMTTNYDNAQVDTNVTGAKSVAWKTMLEEITTAINYDYTVLDTWKDRVKRLENLVVKKKYECGADIDDNTCTKTPNSPHAECDEIYDKEHKISLFMSNYEIIIRHMGKQLEISFMKHKDATEADANDYNITETKTTKGDKIYRYAGYFGKDPGDKTRGLLSEAEVNNISYDELKAITIDSAKTFGDSIGLDDNQEINDDKTWWTGESSRPSKATSTKTYRPNGATTDHTYDYVYTFSGWYLDAEYKYLFDVNDDIKCDLELYAGYDCEKIRK